QVVQGKLSFLAANARVARHAPAGKEAAGGAGHEVRRKPDGHGRDVSVDSSRGAGRLPGAGRAQGRGRRLQGTARTEVPSLAGFGAGEIAAEMDRRRGTR